MNTTAHKEALENELAEITQSLQELGVQNPHAKEDWITTPEGPSKNTADPNDLGDRSEEWQERRGTLSTLETRFNNINRALQKIEKGSFGTCELCTKPIEEDRLAVNPAARTCKADIDNESQLPS
mgnify:CR=1 FL=1